MPKIKLSALASDIKGKAEGSVFSRNSGGLYFRNNPSGGGKKSAKWDKSKSSFGSLASKWRDLTQSEIDAWNAATTAFQTVNAFGDARISSGYELFMRLNAPLVYIGEAFLRTPNSPTQMPSINFNGLGTPDNVLFKSDKALSNVLPNNGKSPIIPSYSLAYGSFVYSRALTHTYRTPANIIEETQSGISTISTNPFFISVNCAVNLLAPKFQLDFGTQEINFSEDDLPLLNLDCGDNAIVIRFKNTQSNGEIYIDYYIDDVLDQRFTVETLNYIDLWNISMRVDLGNDFLDSYISINGDNYSLSGIDGFNQSDAVELVSIFQDKEGFMTPGSASSMQMTRENPTDAQYGYGKLGYIMREADVLYPFSSKIIEEIRKTYDTKTGLYKFENRGILPNDTEFTQTQFNTFLTAVIDYSTYLAPFVGANYTVDSVEEGVQMVIECSPYISSGRQGSYNNFKRILVVPANGATLNLGPAILKEFGPVPNLSSIRCRYYLINTNTGETTSKKYLPTIGLFPDVISTQYCVVSEGSEPWSQGSCPDDYTCVYSADMDTNDCINNDYLYELISDTAGNSEKKPKFKAGAELASSVN
jgi:hypothetical protein